MKSGLHGIRAHRTQPNHRISGRQMMKYRYNLHIKQKAN